MSMKSARARYRRSVAARDLVLSFRAWARLELRSNPRIQGKLAHIARGPRG